MEGGLGEMVGMGEMGMVGEMGMPMPGAPLDGVGQQLPLPEGARSTGQVRRWTNDRGFGFIAPDDGDEDLFCHFSNIVGGNALIQDGQVEFVKVYDDRKGKERAEQVTGSGVTTNEGGGGGMGMGMGMGMGGMGGGRPRGVCYDFQKGQCTRGPACRFAHDGNPDPNSNPNPSPSP